MDKTQFILAIAANIVTIIIMWAWSRLIRGAKTLLTTGTITAKVRQIFTPKRITILGSLLAAIFNLWILGGIIVRGRSFDRWELLSAILVSFLIAYWVNRIVAASGSKTEEKLRAAEARLAELELRNRGRHLTPKQRQLILDTLNGKPNGQLEVVLPLSNPEARIFADELVSTFNATGWQAAVNNQAVVNSPIGIRLWIYSESPTEGEGEASERAQSILDAFEAAGLPIKKEFKSTISKGALVLVVGFKPVTSKMLSN